MKKFIIGLLCGLIISATTAFAASPEVKVLLFPATVDFEVHGNKRTLEGKEVDIINYNNQVYVPLRLFSEKMGALVQYNAPQTSEYVAHINVSLLDTDVSWDQKDRMGNSVPPGDYIVELKGPLTFEYREADEVKVFTQNSGLKTRDSFTIR